MTTLIKRASNVKLAGLMVLAALLSVLFTFISAPLLRVLHNVSPIFYWISGVVMAAGLFAAGLAPIAFLILAVWLAIGIYGTMEQKGYAGFGALFVATGIGTAVSVAGPWLLYKFWGLDLQQDLRESMKSMLSRIPSTQETTSLLAGIQVDADFLMSQLPSMMAILVICALAFALILDRRVAFMTSLRFERVASHLRLLEFRMPDWMIWITMASFLLSFLNVGIPLVSIVALNLINVLVAAYFFQGLAVLETAFLRFRVGFLLRAVVYIFVVGQLFFLLSLVGVIDFWVDFRRRLRGISPTGRDRKSEEHV